MSGHQDSNLGPPAPKAGALPGCATPRKSAESEGFEPSVRFNPYVGLANRWFQPLTQLSVGDAKIMRFALYKQVLASIILKIFYGIFGCIF